MPVPFKLDPQTTALVLIDLQKGILASPSTPYSADQIITRADALARCFRDCHSPVALVRVGWAQDMTDAPSRDVDQPSLPLPHTLPPDWMDFDDRLTVADDDILIVKRQWGAFTGTELDLQLRRRGISTIVLGGIATNFGVESTARAAWELGYRVILAEDATTARSTEAHRFAIATIFPKLGRVTECEQILNAMTSP